MPRLPTRDIKQAYGLHKLLPLLLKECRSINSAQNELRWLREWTIDSKSNKRRRLWSKKYQLSGQKSVLGSMCRARSKGMPLQYILGNQPFGDLEILCERGVLIPRPETESYTLYVCELLISNIFQSYSCARADGPGSARPLRILDICTGTGCISLLLHAILAPHFQQLSVLGIDLSATAIRLAKINLKHNIRHDLLSDRSSTEVFFRQGDVLGGGCETIPNVEDILKSYAKELDANEPVEWDVLVSNPPYISPLSYRDGSTARSVRHFEPKLALVPPAGIVMENSEAYKQEDVFYHRLIALSFKLSVKLMVLECGNRQQGGRVANICKRFAGRLHQDYEWSINIWPDVETGHYGGFDGKHGACAVILQKQPTKKPSSSQLSTRFG